MTPIRMERNVSKQVKFESPDKSVMDREYESAERVPVDFVELLQVQTTKQQTV